MTPELHTTDYIVAIAVLVIPLVIGIIIAFREGKKMTRADYLLGGGRMTLLPVSTSLFITFQSAISLIGMPSEIYRYGTGIMYMIVGFTLCFVFSSVTFVPLMYPLKVTSIYEYLVMRYQSETVRLFATTLGCLQTLFYMAVALLSPALALQAVAGLPLWLSVMVVGTTGTVYTCVGGYKTVIWTDVFQTLILFPGLLTIVIKGAITVGGFSKAWSIADNEGRVLFNKFDPDPRTRMTIWGAVSGIFFLWMSVCYNQATLQRIRSLRSLKEAKLALIVNIPFFITYYLLLMLFGMITFAYFSHIHCDIYAEGIITNANQISPFFVIHAMSDLPGLAGLYLSILFCGSLSTLSSGINALAANSVEDFLRRPLKNMSERSITMITKIIAASFGFIICCIAYGAQYLPGPVTQMVDTIYGSFGSPILGMFFIGCMVPWANKYGALAGGISSLAFALWMSLGALLRGRIPPSLDPAPVDQCSIFNSSEVNTLSWLKNDSYPVYNSSGDVYNSEISQSTQDFTGSDTHDFTFFLYDVSYEWYSVYGFVVCLVVGLAVSYVTRKRSWRQSNLTSKLVFPITRRLWSLNSDKDLPEAEELKQSEHLVIGDNDL